MKPRHSFDSLFYFYWNAEGEKAERASEKQKLHSEEASEAQRG